MPTEDHEDAELDENAFNVHITEQNAASDVEVIFNDTDEEVDGDHKQGSGSDTTDSSSEADQNQQDGPTGQGRK